ncbi:hypothetical protein [Stigmatella hybrida]|uniref:hypothetical protein n=1 Tax=Stigmatella hybrida TaxID=394097 RepID=UPI001CDAD34E|nr:hypothetical protein [Stigmatella hybrida]
MIDQDQVQIISELSRDLVRQIAPAELPRFEAARTAYFEDPDKVLRGSSPQDEILGFGMGELLTQMTPVILTVATQVVTFLGVEIKKQIRTESTGFVGELVKRMFKKFREPMDKPQSKGISLTPELLTRIRETALQSASRLNLPQGQAALLADAVVGNLFLAPAG